MKHTIYLILITISHSVLGQKTSSFETDYFSGSLDSKYPPNELVTLADEVEIELENIFITIKFMEKTNDSLSDVYLNKLSSLVKQKNVQLLGVGKTSVKDRTYFWVEVLNTFDGEPGSYYTMFYLTKVKDSVLLISASIIPSVDPDLKEKIDDTENSNIIELKNILKTIELK